MEIVYHPIGIIHSPFTDLAQMPIQPRGRASAPGQVELLPHLAAGLKDLDGFSHIILLYHLHRVQGANLTVTPFLDGQPRGVFATRAPTRPNPIGLSVVRLVAIHHTTLEVEDLDILDGTPLLDLKPYIPDFDHPANTRIGWLGQVPGDWREARSDDRFK